ncbi:MAG: multidrug MFS transporter [Candidatus Synechococcus spongiarum 142]|uniref:Multidrug MFS transporter n=1 Tax=Candidatus Synechococcus spongiarum 142 TaxID=1608213 RepID=A0A6N3XAC0_9SYNE|nr:MAG: multidrug MFS transporter [Candidatus Synechococcus spongiarum 142]
MRLFTTGCTGFIGHALVPALEADGHELILATRYPDRARRLSSAARVVVADTRQPGPWQDHVATADGVINLAGESIAEKRWTDEHKTLLQQSRIATTRNLVEPMAAADPGPQVLISGSAVGYYGVSETRECSEVSASGDDFLAHLCQEWEAAAQSAQRCCRVVVLRIGIVLGPDGGALGKMLPVFRLGVGGPVGSGRQWMSWIHRTDLCRLIVAALADPAFRGVYNAVAPNPVTMGEMATSLGRVMGRPSLLPVPAPLLQALLGDGAMVVLKGQKVRSDFLKERGFGFTYPRLPEALENIVHASS